jgi:hypothetical protein
MYFASRASRMHRDPFLSRVSFLQISVTRLLDIFRIIPDLDYCRVIKDGFLS